MRKSRNGQRRAFAAFTKFSVLLMCFAVVFALVLTTGVLDGDTGANVAEAGKNLVGGVRQLTDYNGYSNAEFQNKLHNQANTTGSSFTHSTNFNNINFGNYTTSQSAGRHTVTGNEYVSAYLDSGTSVEPSWWNNGIASAWGYTENDKHQLYEPDLYVVLNVKVPEAIMRLVGKYTVNVVFTTRVTFRWDDNEPAAIGLYATSSTKSASQMVGVGAKNDADFVGNISGANSGRNVYTKTMTTGSSGADHNGNFTVKLNQNTTNLVLVLRRGAGTRQTTNICASETVIDYQISKPSGLSADMPSDGNAPRVSFLSGTTNMWLGSSALGNFMSSGSALFDEIADRLDSTTDSPFVDDSTGSVSLAGVVVRQGTLEVGGEGVSGVSSKYAKKAVFTVTDRNEYAGDADVTNAAYYTGLAGIQAGGMTSQSETMYPSGQSQTKHGAFSYGGGSNNGYYIWTVNDQGRTSGTLTLYFNDNAENIEVLIYDSGGSYFTLNIKVDGIKDGGDDLTGSASITDGTRMMDANSASFDGLTWEWDDLTPVFANMGSGADAQIWFYAVQKFNSATEAAGAGALFSATEGNSGITPIGFTDADGRWKAASGLTTARNSGFDFTTGLLYGVAPVNDEERTGNGYYRFEFYPMNYAGYIGTPVVRLVKADVGIAEPDVKLSYDPSSKSGNPLVAGTRNDGFITNYQGAYISTDLTVTITFAANISGNKVSVMGADGENYIFLIGYDGGIKGVYTVSNNALQPSSGKWGADYSMTTGGVFEKVVVSASVAGGTMTVKAVYTAPADTLTVKTHVFAIYTNADDISGQAMANCLNDHDVDWDGWMTDDNVSGNGTRLWFDTVGITDVTLGSTGGQIHEVLFEKVTSEDKEEGKIPAGADRKWYTDGWELAADLSVIANDGEWSSVFYLQKYYTGTITDKATYTGAYDGWTFVSTADGAVTGANGWTLLEEGASITFDANTEGAGYYVIYVIAVDRASNISPLGFYGVLIDANEYTITAVYDEATLAQFGDIDPFNFESRGEQTLKRGALYKFPHGLKAEFITDAGAHAYVPYQISKVRDGENVPIYTADDNDVDGKFKAKYFKEYLYAAVAEDGWSIDLYVDRSTVTALPAIDGETRIVFSYRQVVNATFDNTFTYNGARLPVTVSTTNVFGNQVTVTTGNEPYSIGYPEGYFVNDVTHAGSYDVSLKREGVTSKFFVLNEEVTRTVSVAKAPLTIEASIDPAKDIFFGDMTLANAKDLLGFTYSIAADGLQGEDAGTTDFNELYNASFDVSVAEVSEGSYARIGDHAVNVTFTAGDYTVTVSWTSAQSVNIKARAVEFTVDDPANVTYGDAMPTEYTLRVPKSVFDFDIKGEGSDGLGLYQDAAGVESLIGKTVREDGDYWVFSVPQSDFEAFTANGAGRYNVGTYTIVGFKGTFFINNIVLSMAEGGEGTFEVTSRTITISPAIPEETINVEDASEVKGFTFNISGTPETSAYGLSGLFTAGDPTDVENQYRIVGDAADFTSADNEYKEGNVTIVLATDQSGWVFSINIIQAAGKIVIEFTSADIFTVTYGELFDATAIAAAGGGYYKILYYAKDANAAGGYAEPVEGLPEGVTGVTVTIKVDRYEPEEQNVFNNHYGDYTLTVTAEALTDVEDLFFTYEYRTADGDMPSYVHVGTLNTTVTVSEVTQLSKEYGANDPAIDPAAFGFAFTSEAHQELLDTFIENNGGEISVSGFTAGWDRLSDVGTYGYNWSGCAFTAGGKAIDSNDISFTLEGTESVTFEITQKELNIDKLIADGGILIGGAADKKYDGGSEASATLAFSTAGSVGIIVSGDNVSLAYEANYWKDGENVFDIGSGYSIRFSAITLTGNETDIGNYRLTGNTQEEADFVYVHFVGDGFSIDPNPVNIEIGWFGVTKVYDGTTDIAPQDGVGEVKVTFPQGGTLDSTGWSFVSGKFDSANAGTGVFADITLIFPNIAYPELSGEFELSDYFNYSEDFFALSPVDPEDGSKGMKISITGLSGSITQRTITESYITIGFSAKTKVYDGNGDFGITVGFTDAFEEIFKGSIDLDRQVGLVIAAATNKNVGTHMMEVTGITIADTNNFTLCTHLKGEDGFAAVEEKINGNAATFIIKKKSVELVIDFADGVYDAGKTGPDTKTEPYIRGIIAAEREMVDITSSTFTYSDAEGKAFNYVQKEYFENGHYLHDVVATLVFTVSGEDFSWDNYDFGEIILTENTEEGTATVSGLLLQKAAVLNPKQVTLNLSEITVKDGGKVYDATTDIELIFPEKVYEGQFFDSDLAKLDFTYTAALDNANVGTRNVNISDIKPVLKEANAAETHILDSYSIKFSGSFDKTAVVDPAEVTVEFTIPDKTYDGTRFVNMSAAEGSLVAPENSGRDTWYVAAEQFVNNYFVSVVAAYYDDVNVVRDSGTGNPGYKKGTVIGFELVCTRGTSNYVLVGVEGEEVGVLYNLYSFPAGTNISSAYEYIEGVVTEGGNTYYLVRENNTAAQEVIGTLNGELYATRSYNTATATGRILPAQIDFEVEITNPDAFTKAFDDTTALVTEPTLGIDYRIIVEQIGVGDITGITVSFSGAAVGRQDVIFAVSQTAESNPNYSFNAGDSYTVRGGGYIKKFGGTINAELVSEEGGITATYGTADLSYTVRYYYMSDTEVDITVDAEGNAYVMLEDWTKLFGHEASAYETADVTARRYTKANGEWQQSNNGDHIRITGKFGTPTLLTKEGGSEFVDKDGLVCVDADTYSNVHLDVKADSFNVGIASGSETVTINAKDLRVYVTNAGEGGNFTADYFVGKLPVPVFGLYMVDNVSDLAAFDSWTAVRTTLRGQFMNGETPLTSTDVPTGNYALKVTTTTGNYNVIIVTEAGANAEHKLVITIPELDKTQYKVKTNLKRQYELGADGQGVALDKSDLLNATAVADDNNIINITWTDANGNKFDAPPSDVGTYKWALTVTKKIGGSQEDYIYEGEFTAEGEFTIEKRKITVSLKESVGFTYDDGKAHVITKENLTAKDADGNADEFIALISNNITYLLNGTSCNDMTNAGGYTVVLEFVDSPNYELVNNVGTVYVKAKPITVKVDPASKVYDATNGINGNVGISFTAEGADASDFSVVYRSAGNVVGAITTPGIYTYTIVSKDPNYTVSGESTGNFNVQISKVTYTKDDIDYVTIAFGSPVAVNYYLNDTAVAQGSGYWNIVDANVQKLAGEDGGLVTSGIIRIEMSNNNGVVSTVPGGVTVTARIPAGVGSDFTLYRVTSSGGLEVVEDYTVANGVVTYTTDYISNLVFVGTAPVAGFPWWIIPIIAAALVLTLALAILIAVLVKLHRAPDPIPVEVTPIDSIMPEPPVPAPAAPVAPVIVEVPAADIAPTVYDAPAAVSKHKQPPIIGIR